MEGFEMNPIRIIWGIIALMIIALTTIDEKKEDTSTSLTHSSSPFIWHEEINTLLPTSDSHPLTKTKKEYHHIPPTIKQKKPLYWDWSSFDHTSIEFPKNFLWGVATSAQQVEGNCTNSDWYAWENQGKTAEKSGIACDHWHRYKEDIELIKQLGCRAYRFSIDWSKIEPQEGVFDASALLHYQDVCKDLLKEGIMPVVTLHHYTNPIWFAQKKGFEKIENGDYFVRYASHVFNTLHPYVYMWITFNSPNSYAPRAYYADICPPGVHDMQRMTTVIKNMLDAHVKTYRALKETPEGKAAHIGMVHNIFQVEPHGFWDKISTGYAQSLFDQATYSFFTTGKFKAYIPFTVNVTHANKQAQGALDFIGFNYYSHGLMKNKKVVQHPDEITTQNELFTVYPEGLYRAICDISQNLAKPLKIPIYVTENGIATTSAGKRDLFFKRYLYALNHALQEGHPVQGYFVWSLMDNYEWGTYQKQFGLFAVNYDTQKRTLKDGTDYLITMIKKNF
jgi:beta-glucosidase